MNDEHLQRLLDETFTVPQGIRPTRNLFDVAEFERRWAEAKEPDPADMGCQS